MVGKVATCVDVPVDEANESKGDEGRHTEGDVDELVRVALLSTSIKWTIINGAPVRLASLGAVVETMRRTADTLVRHLVECVFARQKLTTSALLRSRVAGTEFVVGPAIDRILTRLAVARLFVACLVLREPLEADHAVANGQTTEDILSNAVRIYLTLRVLQSFDALSAFG